MEPRKEREREFARILFGVESCESINMSDEAQWRQMLDAIDFAIKTENRGYTVTEKDGETDIQVGP